VLTDAEAAITGCRTITYGDGLSAESISPAIKPPDTERMVARRIDRPTTKAPA